MKLFYDRILPLLEPNTTLEPWRTEMKAKF